MSLATGARIGAYEIVGPLGAGGMGEVWRARDTRLGRDVAIKAIPESLAHDAERVARFEREARLLASLNHPNIGGIHGLEEAGGHRYLVLEFIDGETLAQRLHRGALPIREAVSICRAVAAALEAAHESGVIHRDLKPGNVMVRADGEVKVLDFGLAKSGAAAGSGSDIQLSASPTITHYAGSAAGVILGTAAYMSPEQARGKPVDRRTDIWSFGCLLFECLSGRQTFEGETVSDVIARILEREPDWSALPPATPPAVRELLARCLDKDAKQRLRDIGDARLTLERELSGATSTVVAAAAAPAAPRRGSRLATLGWIAAIVVAAVFAAALASRNAGGPGRSTHLSIALPEDPVITDGDWTGDGQTLVLIGTPAAEAGKGNAGQRLYVRRMDDFELRELPGTQGVSEVCASRDGRTAIFRAPLGAGSSETRLARVPFDGSVPPTTISPWQEGWSSFTELHSGEIVTLDRSGGKLWRFGANGGPAKEIAIDRGSLRATMRLDGALPGDRGLLVTAGVYREKGWATETGIIDLGGKRLTMLGVNGGNSRCLADGTLLFSLGKVLFAAPLDLGKLALRRPPVAVATGIRSNFSYTAGEYMVDDAGTLLFVPGGEAGNERRLGIVDGAGKLRVLPVEPRPYQNFPTVSRDGRTIGIRITNAQGIDELWVGDRDRWNFRRRVSWPQADCVSFFLSPDGRTLAYTRIGRDAEDGIYLADLDGTGPGTRVLRPDSTATEWRPDGWSPDSQWLVLSKNLQSENSDMWIARLSPSRDSLLSVAPLRATEASDEGADFSPDGRWMAFMSRETGRSEIYVAPFADGKVGRAIRVTDQGGQIPEWVGGRQLAYRDLSGRQSYIVDLGADPAAGTHTPREWFSFVALGLSEAGVMHDGTTMVIIRGPSERGPRSLNLVFGWGEELEKKLAANR